MPTEETPVKMSLNEAKRLNFIPLICPLCSDLSGLNDSVLEEVTIWTGEPNCYGMTYSCTTVVVVDASDPGDLTMAVQQSKACVELRSELKDIGKNDLGKQRGCHD